MFNRTGAMLAFLLMAATLVAGCSGGAGKGKDASGVDDSDFDELDLDATDSTGVIRGVIVDEAVRPVASALVTVTSPGANASAASNDNGLFGFEGLQPGTYFLHVGKPGFLPTQQSIEVLAGVREPPITKVLLLADANSGPRVELLEFVGYIECSARAMVIGADCGQFVPGTAPAPFNVNYDFDIVPDFLQLEMIWRSTQAAGDEISLDVSCLAGEERCPAGQTTVNASEGRSPRMITINRTMSETWGFGQGETLHVRTFAFDSDLDVYDETLVNRTTGGAVECVRWPVLFNACIRATGPAFIYNQQFTIYTHAFYEFVPEEGWQFSIDGEPKVPDRK